MTRWMALDVGEARIGVAVSDASGFLASPYTTLRVPRDESEMWSAIQGLIEETEAEGLVVGLPISLDGEIHAQGERVRSFARRLQEHLSLPLTFWDERYSTVEAERLLTERFQDEFEAGGRRSPTRSRHGQHRQHGKGAQSRRGRQTRQQGIDALAAAVILQDFLEHAPGEMKDVKDTML